jgi:hypothetical protein
MNPFEEFGRFIDECFKGTGGLILAGVTIAVIVILVLGW